MVKLGNYYRKAIKDNAPNVENMKNAIYATLHHYMSTDETPLHFNCPTDVNSWCFFNRAAARKEAKPKHDSKNMKTTLTKDVVKKIMPVYQRLASKELLNRCISSKTQNANECLHSVIWSKCPKETFISKKKLEVAVTSAISQFNMGCENTQKLKENATGISLSGSGKKISVLRDRRRLHRSAESGRKGAKTARKKLQLRKLMGEQKKKLAEGPMYAAGQF